MCDCCGGCLACLRSVGLLRLLEILFSALALLVVIFRGKMSSPWGIWCEFVWVFCLAVAVTLAVMEGKSWHILLAAFLPDWADLTCGLTLLCATMVTSATIIFVLVFVCLTCFSSIICAIFSLVATVVFLVDAVMQKLKCPSGYLSNLRGILRMTEAFLACIILSAVTDYFLSVDLRSRPAGMTLSIVIFALCLLVTIVIIVFHLLFNLLRCLLSFGLGVMELVFNALAVLLYLCTVILWSVYGYRGYRHQVNHKDLNIVTILTIVNVVFYIVDLALSIKAR